MNDGVELSCIKGAKVLLNPLKLSLNGPPRAFCFG